MALLWRAVLAAGASALLGCPAVAAQPDSGATDGARHQMGIAISGMGGARSILTLTYPSDPGPQKVSEDVDTLAQAGDWAISAPKRTEEESNVYYEAEIARAVSPDASGSIPLYPFLHAFRRFSDIALVLHGVATGPAGDFTGENRFVSAEGHRSGNITHYTVHVKDASFSRPEDVALTEVPVTDEPVRRTVSQPEQGRPRWVVWLLLALGSLGVGVFVWGLTWWGASLRGSRDPGRKEDKRAPLAKDTSPVTEQSGRGGPAPGHRDS